jgi:ABC-2 type transport system ATP-binding protein
VTLTPAYQGPARPSGAGLAVPAPSGFATVPARGGVPAVSITDVSARYKGADRLSVDQLNLTIPPGIVFGLLGEDGSGKTTTINMITGLMNPSRGSIRVFGHKPGSGQAKECTGVVTQEAALYDQLSARDNLALYAALYRSIPRKEKPRRVEEALSLARLTNEADNKAGTFTGVMQRRLQIARALIHHPHLIILDEPTLGVDPVQRADLWEHIRRLRVQGITIVLTTSVMEEAAALCDRLAIIRHGQLAAVGTPESLRRGRGTVITAHVEAIEEDMELAHAALCADPAISDVTVTRTRRRDRYLVRVTADAADGISGLVIMHLTDNDVVIRDVRSRTATLEEVFLAVTGSLEAVR